MGFAMNFNQYRPASSSRLAAGFFAFHDSLDFGCEFAHPIARQPPASLQDHRLVPFHPGVRFARIPYRGNRPGAQGGGIERNLRPQFLLRSIVGDEVPQERMSRPRPKSRATASVIPWLVSQKRVPRARQCVLNQRLAIPRAPPAPISGESVSPFRWRIARLRTKRKQRGLDVDSRRGERLRQI